MAFTPFPALDAILDELVTRARQILGANFLGAYLQGSFAVGDADEHSDVDFLIVTQDELTEAQDAQLRSMHAEFPTRSVSWAQHLEGSYVPAAALRRIDPERRPFRYVDNGSPRLEWSTHDNTRVVRWSLREHGVTMVGPAPATLVDPIDTDELRDEVRAVMVSWAAEMRERGESFTNAWLQPYVVLSYCRMLHTLEIGAVTSKRAAGQWALGAVDPRWRPLIQQALDGRPDPWKRVHETVDEARASATRAFVDYAISVAGPSGRLLTSRLNSDDGDE
jgi:hypothetical protein